MSAAVPFVAVDVGETIVITSRPRTEELNPLLGRHPSPSRVVLSAAVGVVAAAGLWYVLPPRYRWIVPVALMAVESTAIVWNANNL